MDKYFLVFLLISLQVDFGNTQSDTRCSHTADGQFLKAPNSVCEYMQCVHGHTVSRRCPSGLGVHSHFTHGHRNPCVVYYNHCTQQDSAHETEGSEAIYSQVMASKIQDQFQRTESINVKSNTDSKRKKYLKQLIVPEFAEQQYSHPISHFEQETQNFQGPSQYQTFNFQAPNSNFDSTFNHFLNRVTDANDPNPPSNLPQISRNDRLGPYHGGTALENTYHQPQFSSSETHPYHSRDVSESYQNNYNAPLFATSNTQGVYQNTDVSEPYQNIYSSPTFADGGTKGLYQSRDISEPYENIYSSPNFATSDTQGLHQNRDYLIHKDRKPNQEEISNPTFHKHDTIKHLNHNLQQPRHNTLSANNAGQQEQYSLQNSLFQNAYIDSNQQIQPDIQQPVHVQAPPSLYTQSYSPPFASSIPSFQQQAIIPNPTQYFPETGIVISLPSEHFENHPDIHQHTASAVVSAEPTGQPQQPVPQKFSYRHQTPVTSALYNQNANQALTPQQKRNALTKLIQFILNLSKNNNVKPQIQHNLNQKRILLAKILLKVIEAMKSGSITPRPVTQKSSQPLHQNLGRQPAHRPLRRRQLHPKRQRGQRLRRRRKYQIMGKMAEGQDGNPTQGVKQLIRDNGEQIAEYTDSYDYTEETENGATEEKVSEVDSEVDETNQPLAHIIDNSASGTNAPATEETKFRHMRDGIRVPISKQGTFSRADHQELLQQDNTRISPSNINFVEKFRNTTSSNANSQQFHTDNGEAKSSLHQLEHNRSSKSGLKSEIHNMMESLDKLDRSLFDDVPPEYLEELKKLATEYFNEEYDHSIPREDTTGDFMNFEDFKIESNLNQNDQLQNNLGRKGSQQKHLVSNQEENMNLTDESEDISTIPPIDTDPLKVGIDLFVPNQGLQRTKTVKTDRKQRSSLSEKADKNPLETVRSVKKDTAFQQALAYYAKLLNSLSEFIEESSEYNSNNPATSKKREGLVNENTNFLLVKDFSEQLQNYSYQDMVTDVSENEYQSNEVKS